MIKLKKKDKYTIGIMTGSFHTDYSNNIVDAVCSALRDKNVNIVLMQTLDATRYLSINSVAENSFDNHYYSVFEYGKYLELDLLIVSFGTISALPSAMNAEEFFKPFKNIPIIMIEDDNPRDNSIYIAVDNYKGMYDCVEHLIFEHKLKNILFVSGPITAPDAIKRLNSYKDAMKNNNLEVNDKMIAYGDFTDHVDELIEELLDNNPNAQAICCANDEMAESAYRILKKRNLIPGKDIMITGFDDTEGAKYMNPPLSTVRQSFDVVSLCINETVTKLINGEAVNSINIPANFIIRESCGCKNNNNDEIRKNKIFEERSKIKNYQKNSIVNSLLLRKLLSKGLTSQNYFERIGQILSDVDTSKAFICLTKNPIKVNKNAKYFLPNELYLHLDVNNGKINARGINEGKLLDSNYLLSLNNEHFKNNKQLAIFPLFYQNNHYGALFVELDRSEMFFYYTISLELGTGLYFMQIELENQYVHHELAEQNRVLDYSACHDSLTDCYNRTETIRLANEMMKSRNNENFVIVIADLDYLKHINDTFGHHEGDIAIQKSAEILKSVLPEGGIIGRAGGDEFICFFPDDNEYDAEKFIDDVRYKCDLYNENSNKVYYLDISMGYYHIHAGTGEEFDALFKKADAKLYIDKKTRRKSIIKKIEPKPEDADYELKRYLRQTEETRNLSVPQIREIETAHKYRDTLLNNYKLISEYAIDNISILHNYYYPLMDESRELSVDEVRTLRNFSHELINAYSITNLDNPLAYQQSLRLLNEAKRKKDNEMLIVALDEIVSTSYTMLVMTERFLPNSDICMQYYKTGLSAAEELLTYLDKDIFKTLSDEAKYIVIVNARYIRVVSEIDGYSGNPENNSLLINRMKKALELADDPFYREQLPNYDWDWHEFRTLEYICSLTDYNNEKCFDDEDIVFINECTKRMKYLIDSQNDKFYDMHNTKDIYVYICRNAYLAKEISLEEYKKELVDITFHDYREDPSQNVLMIMLHAPLEYMLIIDKDNITKEDYAYLSQFYTLLITYMHQTPKMGKLSFLLTYLSLILKNFIEIPGEMDFETMCLNLIAALHPPTYVHTLAVAEFTNCFTKHLLDKNPELFIGMPGYENIDDVINHKEEIIDYAYHAALCHDIGKITIVETILTYGRGLLDEEFKYIREHESIGAYLLSIHKNTAKYADIAMGHHKWFNDEAGYPEDFKIASSPYKTVISIVTCADCLDAATDRVGRSYKQGKSLEELINEFKSESGTRYAPFVVDLLDDENVLNEIKDILEYKRDEIYIETYNTLKRHAS